VLKLAGIAFLATILGGKLSNSSRPPSTSGHPRTPIHALSPAAGPAARTAIKPGLVKPPTLTAPGLETNLDFRKTPRVGETESSPRLPSLDGWRALSILLVIGNHAHFANEPPPWLKKFTAIHIDGHLGVQCFFSISGFLITWLLLNEWQKTGAVSLKNFYIRRTLRIVPVYMVFLLTVYLLGPDSPWKQTHESWLGCLTFTRNLCSETFRNMATGHLWSLSLEEQFYCLWPALFLLTLKTKQIKLVAGILAIATLFATVVRQLMYFQTIPPQYMERCSHGMLWVINFLATDDGLALGALSAILYTFKKEQIKALLTRHTKTAALIGITAVLLPELCPVNDAIKPLIQIVGTNLLLLQSLFLADSKIYKFLNWGPILQIGVLSYSIYIWQQVIWFFGREAQNPAWLVVRFAAIFLVAAASYHLMEKPLINLRQAFRDPQPVLKRATHQTA